MVAGLSNAPQNAGFARKVWFIRWANVKLGGSVVRTRLCELLGIEHPIIQAGMGIVHPAHALVAAVSNAGGLGSLGATGRSPSELREQIALIRERTSRPFAVNFLVSALNEDTLAAALAARPAVISFALGAPGALVRGGACARRAVPAR